LSSIFIVNFSFFIFHPIAFSFAFSL